MLGDQPPIGRETVADLVHDVHQPLAIIVNYASGGRRRLERGTLSHDELIEVFGRIVAEAMRADGMIRRLRDCLADRKPSAATPPALE